MSDHPPGMVEANSILSAFGQALWLASTLSPVNPFKLRLVHAHDDQAGSSYAQLACSKPACAHRIAISFS